MGQLHYPQKREINGPWILDKEDLEELDNVITEIDVYLKDSWNQSTGDKFYTSRSDNPPTEIEIQKHIIEKEKESFNNKHFVKCELKTKDGYKLSDQSILGLLKSNELKTLAPNGLNINIVHGAYYEHSFDLNVSNLYSGELEYKIECSDSNIRNEIQYSIDNWIDSKKPSKLLQFWSNYGDFFAYLLFVPLIILLWSTFKPSETNYSTYSSTMRTEAFEIIEAGVDSTNMHSAIDLLLKSESNYVPSNFKPVQIPTEPRNPIYLKILVVAIFVYLVSLIRPKTTIGIGKMKEKMTYHKIWIKFVMITLPGVLIISPLWNFIYDWIFA